VKTAKTWQWIGLLALTALGLLWRSQLPAGAQQRNRGGNRLPFAVRVVFGLKDKQPTPWAGQIRSVQGVVTRVTDWHEMPRDTVGPTAFRVQTQRIQPNPRRPKQPTGLYRGGIFIYGQANLNGALVLTVRNQELRLPLNKLQPGQKLSLMDGQILAEGLPRAHLLTQDRNEEDFPAIAAGPDGVAWAVWASYSGGRDEVRIARYSGNRWFTFSRVPGAGGDIWKPQVGVDGSKRVWVVWSQQVKGNWDVYARSFLPEGNGRWGPPQRLSKQPGSDINLSLASGPKGALAVAWQSFGKDGDANIVVSTLKG